MANFIEDTMNFGFGLFAYSREKVEQFVEKLVDAGKVEKKDAQGFMHDLMERGDEQRKEIKRMIKEEVSSAASDLGISGSGISKDELRAIIREEIAAAKNEGQ